MHPESLELMKRFAAHYLDDDELSILDVGSMDYNGTYRSLFDRWDYHGFDLTSGPNVDYTSLPTVKFDVVISGQTLEHVPLPWEWIKQIYNLVKPGGLVCIIAPSQWPFHEYPIDCWRVFPDGLKALFSYAGLETIEVSNHRGVTGNDTYGVARRPI